ncbi:MAG: glycoside hydrolase family protein [Paludibacter sp.]|nr:glycoside hydrolase family protein [Paludibacter sp.]
MKVAIQPAIKNGGFSMDDYMLWCPSVIKVGKTYHMFASRWPAVYGMAGWTTHSEIIRATSSNLYGPYTFQEVVIKKRDGYWDNERVHNPRVVKSGKYFVLYYSSTSGETGYAYASSINGPWIRSNNVVMTFSNVAPVVKPDGSIYALGRKTVENHRIAQAYSAKSFDGKYSIVKGGENLLPENAQFEDPTIWLNGNIFYVLCSDLNGDLTGMRKAGAQYYSFDGEIFKSVTTEPVYTKTVTFDDNSTEIFSRRERPFVYVDDNGQVQALFTACLPAKGKGSSRIVVNPIKDYLPDGYLGVKTK